MLSLVIKCKTHEGHIRSIQKLWCTPANSRTQKYCGLSVSNYWIVATRMKMDTRMGMLVVSNRSGLSQ